MIPNITGKVLGTVKVHVRSEKHSIRWGSADWHGSDRRLPCLEMDRVWSLQTASRTGHLNLLSEAWWLNVQSGHSKPFWSSVLTSTEQPGWAMPWEKVNHWKGGDPETQGRYMQIYRMIMHHLLPIFFSNIGRQLSANLVTHPIIFYFIYIAYILERSQPIQSFQILFLNAIKGLSREKWTFLK